MERFRVVMSFGRGKVDEFCFLGQIVRQKHTKTMISIFQRLEVERVVRKLLWGKKKL